MHKMNKFPRIISFAAVLFLAWTVNAHAATLYERSLEKLQAGIERVSPADFTFVVLGDSRENDDVFTTVRKIGFPIEVLTEYSQAMNRYAFLLIE